MRCVYSRISIGVVLLLIEDVPAFPGFIYVAVTVHAVYQMSCQVPDSSDIESSFWNEWNSGIRTVFTESAIPAKCKAELEAKKKPKPIEQGLSFPSPLCFPSRQLRLALTDQRNTHRTRCRNNQPRAAAKSLKSR